MKRKFVLLPITLTALAPAISLVGCGDPDTPTPEIIVSWTKGEEFIPPIPAKEFAEGEGVFPNVPTFFKAYYDEIVMQPTIYSEDIAFNLINGCGVMPDAVKVSLGTIGEYYKTTGCFRASVTF
ncbi:MAG: hypothetical protein MJ201_05450 [Mycoplasmoidaceae bacterium]|nr:hypothetical protein [Mycoplasmoidaceae bacterium]